MTINSTEIKFDISVDYQKELMFSPYKKILPNQERRLKNKLS